MKQIGGQKSAWLTVIMENNYTFLRWMPYNFWSRWLAWTNCSGGYKRRLPLLSRTFLFLSFSLLSAHCFSPTLGVARKLMFLILWRSVWLFPLHEYNSWIKVMLDSNFQPPSLAQYPLTKLERHSWLLEVEFDFYCFLLPLVRFRQICMQRISFLRSPEVAFECW